MSDIEEIKPAGTVAEAVQEEPVRVLLLDDHPENLLLRSTILRKHGYITETADSVEEAEKLLDRIDIAVLDYHLGAGRFGTDVAAELRERRPEVPIIILSATLERRGSRLIVTVGGLAYCNRLPASTEYSLMKEELRIVGHDAIFEKTLISANRLSGGAQ